MSNFKAGDLAIIIRAQIQENIGKTVELIELVQPGACYRSINGAVLRNNKNIAMWHCAGKSITSIYGNKAGLIPPKWLMPLRGDFQPEKQKAQEEPA